MSAAVSRLVISASVIGWCKLPAVVHFRITAIDRADFVFGDFVDVRVDGVDFANSAVLVHDLIQRLIPMYNTFNLRLKVP